MGTDEGDEEEDNRPKSKLDEVFDKMMEDEYGDENIGELSDNDPDTKPNDDGMAAVQAVIHEKTAHKAKSYKVPLATMPGNKETNRITHALLDKQLAADSKITEKQLHKELDAMFVPPRRDDWDCQSVLSTYSITDNLPSVIKAPKRYQR
jgi:hypothetical protein